MNELKNIVNQILEGQIDKGTTKIDGYFIGVESIKVFEEDYLCVGYIGADTGKIYNIDYVNEFYDEFIANIETILESKQQAI